MDDLTKIPFPHEREALPAPVGGETVTPAERAALLRELLEPETAAAVETELQRAPGGRAWPLLVAPLLITAFGFWLMFPADRFPGRLREHPFAAEHQATGNAGRILAEARTLHAAGKPDAARALLAPCFRTLAETGSRAELEANGAVLEQFWQWSSGNPRKMELEARRILGRAPDSPVALIYLAEAMLPFQNLAELNRIPVRELRRQTGNFREILLRLDPATAASELPEATYSRILRQLVRANAALWAASGFRSDPGEPGFANRERALELCRRMPEDRTLLQWRCDILQWLRDRPWYFWDYQTIEGENLHYRDLDKRIDDLKRQLGRTQ